ncbi:MAG: CDP-diacylglycerol--glycerol-3-phosphate 3-phosphatidyltransferase [Methyloversatilis sp.]|nr:CDP-diacylglycerol--glycerol-3-phosphate 3-phosphatidyltransferase [Methyloversatilis sp.]MBP6194245.1 CDP-diacylglycerol--glycerol-3-phosphate 3-phosphatidyltransferase [Methyloversatilis sp.]MBP9117544.1 CDP-diacylglycerol--glycerol-3-phosphate 3-phosphatidyltransferase [Methyloversatilis sp.]
MFTVPTALTWARILLIPLFVGVFFLPDSTLVMADKNLTATLIFVLAAVTDWLDGYLARTLNQTSAFGAFLDPVADKLMVAAALIMLVELDRTSTVVAFVIIGREITISALREWMAKVGAARSVAVSMIGKIKTTAQMIAIPMLLFFQPLLGIDIAGFGRWLLWFAAVLTVWSMVYYLRRAWAELRARKVV